MWRHAQTAHGARAAHGQVVELGHPGRRLRQSSLQRSQADQREQRRAAAGGMDHVDRRAARPRGLAARDRRHDVRAYAVSEQRVRGQPEGPVVQVEVRAEAERGRRAGDVLRHGESRPRVRRRQDPAATGRHDAGRARRQHRQGRLEREERRSEDRRDQHERAARLQGQGDHRHLRRRVRRARPIDRLRPQLGQEAVDGLEHRARQGAAGRSRRRR